MGTAIRRLMCIVLVLITLFSLVPESMVTVHAAYENTHKNTGDQRADLIGVALTQVGYREGSNNYTKYGVWYGSANMAWCGAFISWCADQAGIPRTVLKKQGYASLSGFGITDTFTYASGRTPRPGDLFTRNTAHIGIVYYVEGDYFYTIEGNTSTTSSNGNQVCIRKRKLNDTRYTFGSPNYTSDGNHNYVLKYETAHPHKEYYDCTDCDKYYYTGKNGTSKDCQLCIQASCSHKYGEWESTGSSKHQRTCTICQKVETSSHQWDNGVVVKKATCGATGTKEHVCTLCGATKRVTIAATGKHTYDEWTYKNEQIHQRGCSTCGLIETANHNISENVWDHDWYEHWHGCSVCQAQIGLGEHISGEACDTPCEICGYVSDTGHLFETQWSMDENGHWHSCANCQTTDEVIGHTYDNDCDSTCNECGYVRDASHQFNEEWIGTKDGHYRVCDVCGLEGPHQKHTGGPEATEEHGQYCTVCDTQLAEALDHVHKYEYTSDQLSHWGTCRCGHTVAPEEHNWDMQTGGCHICGASSLVQEEHLPHWVFLLPIVAGLALMTMIILLISMAWGRRKRKKKKEKKKELVEV